MKPYHKIDSIYKRDQKGNFLIGDWSRPEFGYLADNDWTWTEKIDGTNIRIMYQGYPEDSRIRQLTFGGRTDNAQIPSKLWNFLSDKFHCDELSYPGNPWFDKFGSDDVCLYGEGYGAGIQKGGGNYISDDVGFILFDVKIGDWWLKREDVEDIADHFNIPVVPILMYAAPIKIAEKTVQAELFSMVAKNRDTIMEGLVGTPQVPLFARNGDRIITKVKVKDYK